MAAENMKRLSKVARELNVGKDTIVDFLATKGFEIENNPNTKITSEQITMLSKEFASSAQEKKEASGLTIGKKRSENIVIENQGASASEEKPKEEDEEKVLIKNVSEKAPSADEKKSEDKEKPSEKETPKEEKKEDKKAPTTSPKLEGIKVVGKIDLEGKKKEKPSKEKQSTAKPEAKAPEKPAAPKPSEAQKPAEQKSAETKPAEQKPAEKPKAQQPKQKTAQAEQKKEEKPTTPPAKDKKEEPVKAEQKPATSKPKTPEAADDEKTAEAKKESKPTKKTEREAEVDVTMEKPAKAKKASKEKESEKQEEAIEGKDPDLISAKADQLKGLTVLGKIELPEKKAKKKAKPVASSDEKKEKRKKRPRKRIAKPGAEKTGGPQGGKSVEERRGAGPGARKERVKGKGRRAAKPAPKEELTDKQIQEQIKQTLARLSSGKGGGKSSRSKYRKEKRSAIAGAREEEIQKAKEEAKTLRVTEFISANDLASLMEVTVNDVISACMSMGMFISINQRLDAEAITLIADEFGYNVDFSSTEEEMVVEVTEDKPEDLEERAPIVTIMGHVDHGKTSLLDYIRSAKVASGEAGGITQHIGAYDVMTDSGKRIAFLDTPGHEAFTAMRARGAKVTDVAIIVVAADDDVMPQTREAINHAQVADVPIVIAINKVDKPTANPDRIKEALANENILVEDWGGKYQCQEISAKTGQGIDELLEKVLLESEMLELKANADKKADGTVIEASLDKGRGYVSTFLVQNGTLKVGDVVLAGAHYGKVKALFDHRGQRVDEAGPATPVLMLGLDGAPQAGDRFNVMDTDREAREMATKRHQILREQSVRTKKHITLDEIGRRLAVGNFKELNIILKGDVDGSVEALSDSLLKLSTEEVQVNIIHKAVGQITESDVLLATASDAIIIGFQVRPSAGARRIAEQEEIDIRLYSIIYNAIEQVKDAMEGMLAPTVEEVIVGNAEIREVFKISKIGTVAGCYVTDGYIKRNHQIRLIRDGIVIYSGDIGQLKRFKDDVNEVKQSYECGMSIQNFNDLKVGDVIEAYEEREIKRTL